MSKNAKKSDRKKPPAKKRSSQKTKKSERKRGQRMKLGFIHRVSAPSERGPNSKCRVCGLDIGKDDERIEHNFLPKPNSKFPESWRFHFKLGCLNKMSSRRKRQFCNKKRGNDMEAAKMVHQMNSQSSDQSQMSE